MIVHHYWPLGSDNIGDHFVARAIQASVKRHVGSATFVSMPVNDRYRAGDRPIGLVGENLERSNAEADLVIVGGSNLLEPRKPQTGKSASGWDWGVFTDTASIERLRPPVMLLGMGTGSSFGKRIRPYSFRAYEEISLLFRRAFASSVRDEMTVEKLGEIDVPTECTGCPVTFFTDRPVEHRPSAAPLMVSFPPSRIVRRWTGRRFMRQAMNYVQWLRQVGVPLVVTLHEERDQEAAREWVPAGVEVFYTANIDEAIDRYRHSCGVIGFRLHAALLGLGLGKPVIPVGVDWRGLGFIHTFELEDLSIRPFRLGQFLKLRQLTDQLLRGDSRLLARLDLAKSRFQAQHESFLRHATDALARLRRQQELTRVAA